MLPLKNKTVLITRSADQSEDFINKLQDLGANTIALPLIETTATNQHELTTLFNTKKYDWLIFTSTNAVKFFFESVNSKNISCKIAVVGEKTKTVVEENGLKVDFIPAEFTAKQLANQLPITENDTVLIPRSDLAKNDIIEILKERRCKVESIAIYKNSTVVYSKTELNNIFKQRIDYITFTSGSTVNSFTKLGITLKNEKVICIGPETEKVAIQNNISVSATANPHTIEGMIEKIRLLITTNAS